MSDVAAEYEDGDINTSSSADDELDAPLAEATLAYLAQSLADEPSAVEVTSDVRSGKVMFSLRVAEGDVGRIIGRRGRTAQSIRALVAAAGARDGVATAVDILD